MKNIISAVALAEELPAVFGGTALATVFSMSGDAAQDRDKAEAQAMPRTRDRPCKCPPESGVKVRRNHSMNPEPREYQGRITGFEYEVISGKVGWSMEWSWEGVDFDGFQPAQCLLQEAKGNYDQFLNDQGEPKFFFTGFVKMKKQIIKQGSVVKANPPTHLIWYFATPRTRQYLLSVLTRMLIPSIYQP